MTSSSPVPRLPNWVFYATWAVLLAAAIYIATQSARPLSQTAILSIVGCVFAGMLVLFIPLIASYERQKNEMLDDRQRALEALARTVGSSAEQISIAAGGLHEMAELSQKNLRHAEQLPHKLQEKIAEFQAQVASVNDVEKEELEKELAELRSSESERLQSIADKIAKTAAELAKVEAATHQHVTAANEALAKLSLGTASAIGKAQAAAEQALGQARVEAARALGDASGAAIKSIEAAKAGALSEIAAKLDAQLARLDDKLVQLAAATEKLASTGAMPREAAAPTPTPEVAPSAAPEKSAEPEPTPAATAVVESTPAEAPLAHPSEASAAENPAEKPDAPAHPPKRARKPRREEPAAPLETTEAAAPANEHDAAVASAPIEPAPSAPPSVTEPAPIAMEQIAEIAPVAPHTASPFPEASASVATPPAEPTEAAAEPPKPARKRAARKSDDSQPGLGLDLDDTNGSEATTAAASGVVERVLTSDGATRLLVTAYIGIGNRLFIRGEGPGLSWEKGVPLQFVSIGKWRWESNDAAGPVQFKLFKNDEQECVSLGTQTLDPGHQQEVTAAF